MKLTDRTRRTFLQTVGTGALLGVAGCLSRFDEPGAGASSTQPRTENLLYAFSPGAISIIDPEAGEVLNEITLDGEEVEWADALVSSDGRHLFVNNTTRAQVIVVDTRAQEIAGRIEVGPDPVHMYHPRESEFWTHSDAEGAFYVIDPNEHAVTGRVVAAQTDTGHGKLAAHEQLGSKGYATNTNDPGVHVLDVDAKEATGFIEFEGGSGTHAQRYNPVSDRAYFELVGGDSPRTAVVDVSSDSVETYYDVAGHIYNTPDGGLVVWTDKANDQVHVLDAESGEFEDPIPVEGGPDKIYFHVQDGTTYGFTANTQSPDTAVIDFERMEVVTRISAGDIERPEGAQFLHRSGLTADGYFFTPASGDGVVSIIDTNERSLHAKVPVAEGVEGVAYVGRRE